MNVRENVIYNKDLMPLIFSHLGAKDLVACGRVCKLWNEAVYKLEHTWKTFCEEYSIGPKIPGCTWKDTFGRLFTTVTGDPVSEYKPLSNGIAFSIPVIHRDSFVCFDSLNRSILVYGLINGQELNRYSLGYASEGYVKVAMDDFNLIAFETKPKNVSKIYIWELASSGSYLSKEIHGGAIFSNRHLISYLPQASEKSNLGAHYTVWNLDQLPLEPQYEGEAPSLACKVFQQFFYRKAGVDCLISVTENHCFQILDLKNGKDLYFEGAATATGMVESILRGSYLTSLYNTGSVCEVRCWNLDQCNLYASFKVPTYTTASNYRPVECAMSHDAEKDLYFYYISGQLFIYRMQTGVKLHEIKSAILNPICTGIAFYNNSVYLQENDRASEVHRFVPKSKQEVTDSESDKKPS